PGILYVGDNLNMFGELHDALNAMIPGDIIEIRCNRILAVEPVTLDKPKQKPTFAVDLPPIMIRAADGFFPVIRAATKGAVIRVSNRVIWLKNLHFTGDVYWFRGSDLTVVAQLCSITGGWLASGDSHRIYVDRSVLRRGLLNNWLMAEVGIYRSFIVGIGQNIASIPYGPYSVEVRQTTFVRSGIVAVIATSPENATPATIGPRYSLRDSAFNALVCCPQILGISLNDTNPTVQKDKARILLRQALSELDVQNNVLAFWGANESSEGWASIHANNQHHGLRAVDFPVIKAQLQPTLVSSRVREYAESRKAGLISAMTRNDAILTSDNAEVNAALQQRTVGCIPELLPLIPPEASEQYQLQEPTTVP
ncbi:MAG: hypothetical protein RIK87_04245, partial [Fuerstiella sp.]